MHKIPLALCLLLATTHSWAERAYNYNNRMFQSMESDKTVHSILGNTFVLSHLEGHHHRNAAIGIHYYDVSNPTKTFHEFTLPKGCSVILSNLGHTTAHLQEEVISKDGTQNWLIHKQVSLGKKPARVCLGPADYTRKVRLVGDWGNHRQAISQQQSFSWGKAGRSGGFFTLGDGHKDNQSRHFLHVCPKSPNSCNNTYDSVKDLPESSEDRITDEFADMLRDEGIIAAGGYFNSDDQMDIAFFGIPHTENTKVYFGQDNSWSVSSKPANLGGAFHGWARNTQVRPLVLDANGDGLDDIALILSTTKSSYWKTIPIAFSKGDGSFDIINAPLSNEAFTRHWIGAQVIRAVAGDFFKDSNGEEIFLMGGGGWNTIPMAVWNEAGKKFNISNNPSTPSPDMHTWSREETLFFVTDANRDGLDDIIFVGGDWSTIPTAYSDGGGNFRLEKGHPVSSYPTLKDITRDGKSNVFIQDNNIHFVRYQGYGMERYILNTDDGGRHSLSGPTR